MAQVGPGRAQVHARIVYWGAPGAGKSANLREIYRRLRPDHRGQLREMTSGGVRYEVLPIELGEIGGAQVQIQVVAPPGAPEHAAERKQLLDRADGVVLVVDSQAGRIDANLAAFDELCSALAAYDRDLNDLPVVVQYNKRDQADPYAVEELHRKLDLGGAAVFEAVATQGPGVLQTLTTISKRVIRHLREHGTDPELAAPSVVEGGIREEERRPEVAAEVAETAERAQAMLDPSLPPMSAELGEDSTGSGLSIEAVGQASRAGDAAVRVPVVLSDGEGRRLKVGLTVRLDLLTDAKEEK